VTLLLQILVIYVATSLTIGVALAIAVGKLIRRGDRRREHEVAVLARPGTEQAAGSRRFSPSATE
jgi:hypothetical protein